MFAIHPPASPPWVYTLQLLPCTDLTLTLVRGTNNKCHLPRSSESECRLGAASPPCWAPAMTMTTTTTMTMSLDWHSGGWRAHRGASPLRPRTCRTPPRPPQGSKIPLPPCKGQGAGRVRGTRTSPAFFHPNRFQPRIFKCAGSSLRQTLYLTTTPSVRVTEKWPYGTCMSLALTLLVSPLRIHRKLWSSLPSMHL